MFNPIINFDYIVKEKYRIIPSVNIYLNNYSTVRNMKIQSLTISDERNSSNDIKKYLTQQRERKGKYHNECSSSTSHNFNEKKMGLCFSKYWKSINTIVLLTTKLLDLYSIDTNEKLKKGDFRKEDVLLYSLIFNKILGIVKKYMQNEYKVKASMRLNLDNLISRYLCRYESDFYDINYSPDSIFADAHQLNKIQ